MKVILINGPARSGKDSLAAAFLRYVRTHTVERAEIVKFAGPLKEAAHRLFGVAERHDSQEAVKDVPQEPLLFGKTWRQVYIAVSELLFKPLFGRDIFGRLLADEIELIQTISTEDGEEPAAFFVVSDSGFQEEAEAVVKRFGAGRVMLVKLTREGYTFAGDSRSYIALSGVPTLYMDLGPNLRELDACVEKLFNAAEAF